MVFESQMAIILEENGVVKASQQCLECKMHMEAWGSSETHARINMEEVAKRHKCKEPEEQEEGSVSLLE